MKLTQQKIVEMLESKTLVDRVLGELNFIQALPESGLIAGQAVASVISDLLGINGLNPVVNDIDIFIPFHSSFQMSKETAMFFATRNELYSNNLSSIREIIMEEDYREIKLSTGPLKYEIVGTTRFKKINKVFVQSKHYSQTEQRINIIFDIINSFDINSTQVGIDIHAKKLIYTKNFVYFLFSKQLEIVNWNTPSHSLIRLIRKNNELGSYVDFEESNMIASVVLTGYKNLSDLMNYYSNEKNSTRIESAEEQRIRYEESGYPFHNTKKEFFDRESEIIIGGTNASYWIELHKSNLNTLPLFFGKKQKRDFEKFSHKLDSFHLARRVEVNKKVSETDFEWFGENGEGAYELHSLLPNNSSKEIENLLYVLRSSNLNKYGTSLEINKTIETIENNLYELGKTELERRSGTDPFSLFYVIPKVVKSFKNVRKNVIHFFNEGETNIFDKSKDKWDAMAKHPLNYHVNLTLAVKLCIGAEELNSLDKYELLGFFKKMKKHNEIEYLYYQNSFSELQRINSVLNKLEKEYGEIIYGTMSRLHFRAKDLTYENVSPYVEKLLKIKAVILKERGIDLSSKIGKIKELVSGLELMDEGNQMGHCVGGYTNHVKTGESIILAMENSNKLRMTLELRPNPYLKEGEDGAQFLINQLYGKFNKKISDEDSADLLNIVNETYRIYPIPERLNSIYQAPNDPFPDIEDGEEIPF